MAKDTSNQVVIYQNSKDYITKMRKRDEELAKGWGQIVTPLLIETSGGPQKLNCANTEGIFRRRL